MNLSARSFSEISPKHLVEQVWRLVPLMMLLAGGIAASAGDLKLEAQLVWGTNQKSSPNDKHPPVQAELKKKLQDLPLKWTNYFEVKKIYFNVPSTNAVNVPLSEKCRIEVRSLGGAKIEASIFGKGEKIATRTQALPRHETLIFGGEAPGETSWFVVLRRPD